MSKVGVMCRFKHDSVTYHSSPRCASSQALSVCKYHCLVTRALDNAPGYGVCNQTRDLSGQSTPHVIRSRATRHVIQSATLATFQVRFKYM